jgi:hypothetical protein
MIPSSFDTPRQSLKEVLTMNYASKLMLMSVSVLALVSQSAFADDASARQSLENAKKLYAQRSATSMKAVDDSLAALATAEGQAQDKELKFDILILESRALYFKGTHADGDNAKKDLHSRGQAKADAAEALTSDYAESAYYAGINLARWGEANGIISSVSQVPTLKKYMAKSMDRTTRDDKAGETVDGFGAHRVLGRMYKKLPGLLGGSHSESVKELDKAVKGDPTTALNVVYLADSLMKDGNDAEQAEGRRLLTDLLAKDPSKLNADRAVEAAEEFAAGRLVLAGKEIN